VLRATTDVVESVDAATGGDYNAAYITNGGWPAGGIASANGKAYAQFVATDQQWERFSPLLDLVSLTGLQVGDWIYSKPDGVSTYFDGWGLKVPAVDAGIAYASVLGQMTAVDANTFAPLWTWGRLARQASPAVDNGVVVFYDALNSRLVALRGSRPDVLWGRAMGWAFTPILSSGVVYVGSNDKYLYAIDAVTGIVQWRFATGSPFTALQIPAISGALIYVPGADGILYALDKMTGVEVWRYAGTAAWGPVIIGGGMVYACDLTMTCTGFRPAHLPAIIEASTKDVELASPCIWKSRASQPTGLRR
jgi:outer membrane protein assembly factor BamB